MLLCLCPLRAGVEGARPDRYLDRHVLPQWVVPMRFLWFSSGEGIKVSGRLTLCTTSALFVRGNIGLLPRNVQSRIDVANVAGEPHANLLCGHVVSNESNAPLNSPN